MKRSLALTLLLAVGLLIGSTPALSLPPAPSPVLPAKLERVFSGSPPVSHMIYALDPSLLIGLNFRLRDHERRFFRKDVAALPVLGGFFGQGQTANLEAVLQARPQAVIVWSRTNAASPSLQFEKTLREMGIPVLGLTFESVADYPGALETLGGWLHRESRARELAQYGRKVLADVQDRVRTIPPAKRLKVYYAEGLDGLSSEFDTSIHAELIPLAGGVNILHGPSRTQVGLEKVSMEQVLALDPDVILVQELPFYQNVFQDPRWTSLRAVKAHRVYRIPREPFNWFDRPPSFMRFLGVQWLARTLYPERFSGDFVVEAQAFYRLFLNVEVSTSDMKAITFQR